MTKVLAVLIAIGSFAVAVHALSAREAPPTRVELQGAMDRATGAASTVVDHECRRHASRLYGDQTYVCRVSIDGGFSRTLTVTAFDGRWIPTND